MTLSQDFLGRGSRRPDDLTDQLLRRMAIAHNETEDDVDTTIAPSPAPGHTFQPALLFFSQPSVVVAAPGIVTMVDSRQMSSVDTRALAVTISADVPRRAGERGDHWTIALCTLITVRLQWYFETGLTVGVGSELSSQWLFSDCRRWVLGLLR